MAKTKFYAVKEEVTYYSPGSVNMLKIATVRGIAISSTLYFLGYRLRKFHHLEFYAYPGYL